MTRTGFLAALVSVTALSSACPAGEKNPWKPLALKRTEIAGMVVFYENGLADQLQAFEPILKEFLSAEAERKKTVDRLQGKSDEILGEINRIVGVEKAREADAARQEEGLAFFLKNLAVLNTSKSKLALRLVRGETIKDYLRKGGTLPEFSYDTATDKVSYQGFIRIHKGRPGTPLRELVIPVVKGNTLLQAARKMLGVITQFGRGFYGMAFHEVAEFTILNMRLRPYDPYFRWFSDGFANVIAAELLGKYVGPKAAKEFAAGVAPAKYADLADQVNLRYWMGEDFCIDTPLESEKRLSYARYAFATAEARRLVDRHGIRVVRAILDKAATKPTNDSRQLILAASQVAGEDIEKRLRRYQSFDTAENGLKKYAQRFNAAIDKEDYAAAMPDLLRALELKFPPDPRTYSKAAWLLFRMGHEDAGDRAILKHLGLLKARKMDKAVPAVQMLFVSYAVRCRNFQKAHEIAELVLETRPDFVPALVVRMDRLGRAGRVNEAKKLARRILELDKDEKSLAHTFATTVLERKEKAADTGSK